MSQSFQPKGNEAVLPAEALSSLFDLLVQEGFQPVGPTVQDGHLVLDNLNRADDLPQGLDHHSRRRLFPTLPPSRSGLLWL